VSITPESEHPLRELADQLPHGLMYRLVHRPDGSARFTFVSAGVEQVLSLSPHQLYGDAEAFGRAVLSEDRPALDAAARRAIEVGGSLDHTFRVRNATGEVRWLHSRSRPRPEPDGSVVWDGVCLDVTAARQFEAELRESEERFRAFMDHCPAAAFIKDAHGRYLYANPVWRAQFDPPPSDWIGKTDYDFWPPATADVFRASDRACLDGGEVRTEETATGPDGVVRTWLVMKFAVARHGERLVAGMAWDVTDRKRLEAELRQAHKMDAVGRLAGGVAHDFNNLLTVINGYGDVALGTLGADHPVRPLVEEIRKAGDRAAGLTRQLLAFSRKQMLQPKVLDLGGLVADLGRMLRRVIGEDVELVLRPGPGPTWVTADPGQLEQVVMNLAVNARDAMPRGGRLTIETRAAEPDPAVLAETGEARPGPHVLLAVSDTGCGMDEVTKARVFEPFFTTKELGKGTGLGLATVYGIVRQSGGHIAVDSRPGHGTTFRVYLPAAPAPARAPAADRSLARPVAAPAGETVLLVEDDEEVRMLALRTLQDAGYVVLDAANGDRALQVARTYGVPIRLLVTDVVMPGMGGRELAERLLAEQRGLRVLYVSGYTDDAVVRHGIESDRVHYVPKPYTPAALVAKVREVLGDAS
jgi:two-component system, cell cycle sensor histidine kinase and response regulator CckA